MSGQLQEHGAGGREFQNSGNVTRLRATNVCAKRMGSRLVREDLRGRAGVNEQKGMKICKYIYKSRSRQPVFVVQPGFINRSVYARLQVSVCRGYVTTQHTSYDLLLPWLTQNVFFTL